MMFGSREQGPDDYCRSCGRPCAYEYLKQPGRVCAECAEREARDEEANREYLNREYLRSQEGDWIRGGNQ
jgi:recombinational DNA repair protein (RecF pathway)